MSSNEKKKIICSEVGETSVHIKKSYHKDLDLFFLSNGNGTCLVSKKNVIS